MARGGGTKPDKHNPRPQGGGGQTILNRRKTRMSKQKISGARQNTSKSKVRSGKGGKRGGMKKTIRGERIEAVWKEER